MAKSRALVHSRCRLKSNLSARLLAQALDAKILRLTRELHRRQVGNVNVLTREVGLQAVVDACESASQVDLNLDDSAFQVWPQREEERARDGHASCGGTHLGHSGISSETSASRSSSSAPASTLGCIFGTFGFANSSGSTSGVSACPEPLFTFGSRLGIVGERDGGGLFASSAGASSGSYTASTAANLVSSIFGSGGNLGLSSFSASAASASSPPAPAQLFGSIFGTVGNLEAGGPFASSSGASLGSSTASTAANLGSIFDSGGHLGRTTVSASVASASAFLSPAQTFGGVVGGNVKGGGLFANSFRVTSGSCPLGTQMSAPESCGIRALGTSHKFVAVLDKESQLHFGHIGAMANYAQASFEELRLQDYKLERRSGFAAFFCPLGCNDNGFEAFFCPLPSSSSALASFSKMSLPRAPSNQETQNEHARWYFLSDDKSWLPFDRSASATLELWYKSWMRDPSMNQSCPLVQSGKYKYHVDFESMTQTSLKFSTRRHVDRVPIWFEQHRSLLQMKLDDEVLSSLSHLPEEAAEDDENNASSSCGIEISSSSNRHCFLEAFVKSAVAQHRAYPGSDDWRAAPELEVISIHQICTSDLISAYKTFRKRVLKENKEACIEIKDISAPLLSRRLNEYLLCHGAGHESIEAITRQGFDAQRAGERGNGTTYAPHFGFGSYFADLASKSDAYTTPDNEGIRTLILSRVLLGTAYAARQPMRQRQRAPDGYHSVCGITKSHGGVLDHREYVVYKDPQALPLFSVRYRHAFTCSCAVCTR